MVVPESNQPFLRNDSIQFEPIHQVLFFGIIVVFLYTLLKDTLCKE